MFVQVLHGMHWPRTSDNMISDTIDQLGLAQEKMFKAVSVNEVNVL